MTSLSEAAAFICQQWPCFPCGADKRPVTAHGFKDAVSDPDAARRLFRTPGAALIGVATGAASNLAVVDLDVKHGGAGLEWLAANQHRLPRTRTHLTRSGGKHLLFNYPAGRTIRNSASKIGPGVDIRADGGYVIVPPSTGYSIADDAMPADMPAWLVDLLDPPYVAPRPVAPVRIASTDGSPYGLRALERECAAVANAPPGTQETTLNSAGLKLGALVAGGELAMGVAMSGLIGAGNMMAPAAGERPWSAEEVRKKVERAIHDGASSPRQAPPREIRHVVRIEVGSPHDDIPWQEMPEHLAIEPGDEPLPAHDPETGVISTGAAPAKGARTPLPLLWFDDIAPVLDAKDFVQGVLIEASAAVVYGESNAGKTFWTTDLALHVAAGKEWNGKRVEQGGVVYCVLEGGVGFHNRVAAWRSHHQCTGPVHFAAVQSSLNLLNPEADTPRLIETVAAAAAHLGVPVKLVIIDTLARAFAGGNENASEDMGLLVQNMDEIRKKTGACVLFVHHSGKDQAKGARGHSSLRAALDTEIEVVADEATGVKTATAVKQREVKKGDAFNFSLEVVTLGQNRHGEDVTTCLVADADPAAVAAMADADKTRMSPDQQAALRILTDLLVEPGRAMKGGYGLPEDCYSVPEAWWRDRFYSRAKPGAADAAKQKAFRRAADALIEARKVGMDQGRVWLP